MKALNLLALSAAVVFQVAGERPSKIRITAENEPGIPMIVTGKVIDQNRMPLSGVKVYIYHTDAEGLYNTAGQAGNRLHGTLWTDKEGKFEFRTIRPAPYPGSRSGEHFHLLLSGGGLSDSFANVAFFDDRQTDKLQISVGREGTSARNYSGSPWKPDAKIKGQRLDLELRIVR